MDAIRGVCVKIDFPCMSNMYSLHGDMDKDTQWWSVNSFISRPKLSEIDLGAVIAACVSFSSMICVDFMW